MSLVKMLLNAVCSEFAYFGTLDVSNFYYGADIFGKPPSIRIPLRHYPASLLSDLNLPPFVQTDRSGQDRGPIRPNATAVLRGFRRHGWRPSHRLQITGPAPMGGFHMR